MYVGNKTFGRYTPNTVHQTFGRYCTPNIWTVHGTPNVWTGIYKRLREKYYSKRFSRPKWMQRERFYHFSATIVCMLTIFATIFPEKHYFHPPAAILPFFHPCGNLGQLQTLLSARLLHMKNTQTLFHFPAYSCLYILQCLLRDT